MYKLSKDEENLLKLIIKHARIDYFRNNNLYFNTEDIDDIEIASDLELENEIITKYESEIKVSKIEEFFTEDNIFKITKELTYNEKLVLFLYYVEQKNDREIGEILSQKTNTIYMKRFRIIEKIKKKLKNGGN